MSCGLLYQLHDAAGLPAENPHKGMPMPGMVTPELVTEAAAASGAAFDKLLRKHIREHMEQGVRLATSEAKAGVEPQTKALAAQMIVDREAYLPRLSEPENSRSVSAFRNVKPGFRKVSSEVYVIYRPGGRPLPLPQVLDGRRSSLWQLVVRVQRRSAVRLVQVEAARVTLQATVDAVA